MHSRTTFSLVTTLLLTAGACAHQLPDDMTDSVDDGGSGGSASTAAGGSSGTTSVITVSGSTSIAGKPTAAGGSTALPPAGSGGKTSSGGSTSGGKGGKGGSGGATGGSGGDASNPMNMPIVGLSLTFMPESKTDPVDFLGGELDVINDTAQPLTLADLKVRYYFSDEITAATPSVMMNWAQFGPKNNLGGATCTGQIVKSPTPKPGADSYIELSCSASAGTDLTAGTLLKISWKAGAQGQGKFIQADDWSFSDPNKIVIMNGTTIVWGVAP